MAVSAGGTREYLDPVRFLGNASSGLMGWALARAAVLRGATYGWWRPTLRARAAERRARPVVSTADLADAMTVAAKEADIVVMAAAPADFTPATTSRTKIKKSGGAGSELELVQTTDVLAGLVADRTDARQVLVGFAAETPMPSAPPVGSGPGQAARKGCDLLVLNEVGHGRVFGQTDSEITLIGGSNRRPDRRQQGHACPSHLGCCVELAIPPVDSAQDPHKQDEGTQWQGDSSPPNR